MGKSITLTIDGREVTVPEGTLIVDAAKKIGIDIPVFCYHPKMEPVGMCRMCLVDIGRPTVDRATGEFVKDETGKPRIQFGPKLDTACTTPVSQGMVVHAFDDKVSEARKDILEFLLTSHPLDCPICDKGGECPLQNLTLRHGPGVSRYLYDEKKHLAKRVPLGELIVLDRERCIQCARCIRFQDEIVDDPVLEFYQRGRALEIVTFSEPGFDSYFSGNTTDICPVGALTTRDFRFTARPWELNNAASICPHCPVGCNLTINVRREAASGGQTVIKRIMPRQNEEVNEIWICDKGRWGYHYTEQADLLTQPLIRKGNDLVPAEWSEALDLIEQRLRALPGVAGAAGGLVTIAGGRLSNEDLFHLRKLNDHFNGQAVLQSGMGGGDVVAHYGLTGDANIKEMGKGSAILVAACDLEEEAPIWWLRVKQAAGRGAAVISLNPRQTKLDRAAQHRLRYEYGTEVDALASLLPGAAASEEFLAAAKAFAEAENVLIIYGSEGAGLAQTQALAETAARLLAETGHAGKPGSGLMAAWPEGNTQGAWEMGFRPAADLESSISTAGVLYLAAADPAGEDPRLIEAINAAGFVVVQDMRLSETACLADVVLPVSPFTQREGTYTSGERRVQRFYPAVPSRGGVPDFAATAAVANRFGLGLEEVSAQTSFRQLAGAVPAFAALSYPQLAQVHPQDPIIGRKDLYYGGTSYANLQGLGVRLQPAPEPAAAVPGKRLKTLKVTGLEEESLLAVPVTRLYDQGQTFVPSHLLDKRKVGRQITINPADSQRLGLTPGTQAKVSLSCGTYHMLVLTDETLPAGVALVPRSAGIPIDQPSALQAQPLPQPA